MGKLARLYSMDGFLRLISLENSSIYHAYFIWENAGKSGAGFRSFAILSISKARSHLLPFSQALEAALEEGMPFFLLDENYRNYLTLIVYVLYLTKMYIGLELYDITLHCANWK
jgi:hypothetical protein